MMTAADTHRAATIRLAHYPITFFAIGMGMMGATLAIRSAEHAFKLSNAASTAALILSVAMLAAVAFGYAAGSGQNMGAVVGDLACAKVVSLRGGLPWTFGLQSKRPSTTGKSALISLKAFLDPTG